MSETAPLDRRQASRAAIDGLVNRRSEMLSLYNELAELRPFEAGEILAEALNNFCCALIDYSAEAHFRLYRFIENASERRRAVREVAERVYPRISESTDCILEFNDLYGEYREDLDVARLERHLSKLGEILADRIELEDQIIAALTRPRSAPPTG